jgi:molybdopterin/thiamine biosynthesis adenylyltransferase/rhodanese-related sulfurtransferase
MTTTAPGHRGTGAQFSSEELVRYGRHLILPDFGMEAQERLKAASVLIIGAGGLGSPVALYLAAAGVGHLGIVDFDVVDLSNLQRQVLHGTADVGEKKLDSARRRLADINPHVRLTTHDVRLTAANALEIIAGYDLVVDGTDNFATRYLVNDACVILGRPNVYGSIFHFDGQASVFGAADGPCYRCAYPSPPPPGLVPSCAEGGVLGVLPGLVGVVQATEAIKLITGVGESLVGRLLLVDALSMGFRTVNVRRDPACPACGTREIRELIDYEGFCGLRSVSADLVAADLVSADELANLISEAADFDLIDVREPHEFAAARIPGSRLIPLGELPRALAELDPSRDIVVHCKAGGRSAKAARILRDAGFAHVRNLEGGMDAWLRR